MDKYMRQAVESLIVEAARCSMDNHGFIQGMPMETVAEVLNEYDKWLKKHGKGSVDKLLGLYKGN